MKYNPLRNAIIQYLLVLIIFIAVIILNKLNIQTIVTLSCLLILNMLATCDLVRHIDSKDLKQYHNLVEVLNKRNKELEDMLNNMTLNEILNEYEKYNKTIVINDGKVTKVMEE